MQERLLNIRVKCNYSAHLPYLHNERLHRMDSDFQMRFIYAMFSGQIIVVICKRTLSLLNEQRVFVPYTDPQHQGVFKGDARVNYHEVNIG